MLLLVTVAIFQFVAVQAAEPCSDGTNFNSVATSCPNTKPDAFCKALFPGTGVVTNNGPTTVRDPGCLKAGSLTAPLCAKQCGLCCQQKEYDCENPKVNPLNCSAITQEQCNLAGFRETVAKWCPNVCGLCASNGCFDKVTSCAGQMPGICFSIDMYEFAAENCRKSCDQCSTPLPTTKTSAPTTAVVCVDRNLSCTTTMKDLCNNPLYINHPDKTLRPDYLCPKTCGYCT